MVEESFPLGAIPERLKCAQCTSLAREAWKLACCEQIICGACYEKLPTDACPICAFSPFEKDKCVPSTSLRTTIAVFLRHAEKRHNDALAKEAKENELKTQSKDVQNEVSVTQMGHDAASGVSIQQDVSMTNSGQYAQDQQTMTNFAQNNGMPNSGTNDFEQRRQEQGNIYPNANFPMGMGMGFDPMMMGGFPMGQFNPMIMAQMSMSGGYGGYGNNGMDWNQGMTQHTTQNMNMQTQENTFTEIAQNNGSAMHENNSGSFHGYNAPKGPSNSSRSTQGLQRGPVAPVYVEGAPTGPSAMRNGLDSRGANGRGRGRLPRTMGPNSDARSVHKDLDHREATDLKPKAEAEPLRGRSMTRSVTRDRSVSPRRRRSPLTRIASRSRERSLSRPRKQRSDPSRSRSPESRQRRPRSRGRRSRRSDRGRRNRSSSRDGRKGSAAQDPISLADRIGRLPDRRSRSRSRSPRQENQSQKSSGRRRSRSKDNETRQQSPSRSPTRKGSSRSERRRHRDRGRRHRRRRNDGPKEGDNGTGQGKPRSGEGNKESGRGSRRSNPKYEINGSPELRRIEEERERSRYD